MTILGGDGLPVIVVSAREAWVLRDALAAWHNRKAQRGTRQRSTAVLTLLADWDRAAGAYETRLVSAAGPAPSATTTTPGTVEIDTTAAADRLGCSARHVRRLTAAGDLQGRRVGRTWLVTLASVEHHRARSSTR